MFFIWNDIILVSLETRIGDLFFNSNVKNPSFARSFFKFVISANVGMFP